MQLIIGIHARLHGVQTDATWIAEFRCVEQVNQPAQVGLQAIGPLVVDASSAIMHSSMAVMTLCSFSRGWRRRGHERAAPSF